MAHFAKSTEREAPCTPELAEPACAAGAVVGGVDGGIIIGGAVDPLRRFAAGGSPCGRVGALEAPPAFRSIPIFCNRAHGGATVGGVGVTATVAGFLVGAATGSTGLGCCDGVGAMAIQAKVRTSIILDAVAHE